MSDERWWLVAEYYPRRARARGGWSLPLRAVAESALRREPKDCKPRVIQAATAAEAAEIYERR
ncbi:MAG: hypothetical protein KQI62_09105 [Deltaproteobacteria bacterium]|nr:hypothetical protein [Deltaproteobacteria bacterium]